MLSLLHRGTKSEERRIADLPLWAISEGVSVFLIDLDPYEPCHVAGIVERLRLDPRGGYVEATLSDGTAAVAARWPIRTAQEELAVVPGRAVVLEGIALVGNNDGLIMENPAFRIVPFPHVP